MLWQVLKRTVRRAWTKEELWAGNRESWRLSFLSRESIIVWSVQTYRLRRRQYGALFADPKYEPLKKIRLTRRRDVDTWLAEISHSNSSV